MEKMNYKCSSKEHENIDAISHCIKCEIHMCNKCEIFILNYAKIIKYIN